MYFLYVIVPLLLVILVAQTGLSIMKLEAILKVLSEKKD